MYVNMLKIMKHLYNNDGSEGQDYHSCRGRFTSDLDETVSRPFLVVKVQMVPDLSWLDLKKILLYDVAKVILT